jgi:hypothetical protein
MYASGEGWDFMDPGWTDGKNLHWNLREFGDELLRGHSCGELFWLSETRSSRQNAGELVHKTLQEGGPEPPQCDYLRDNSYQLQRAIDEDLCRSRGSEIHVRMRLWWIGNDVFRPLLSADPAKCQIVSANVRRAQKFVENLKQLFYLLDAGDVRELVLRAEISRELGFFEEASSLLTNTAGMFYQQQETELARSAAEREEARKQSIFADDPMLDWSPTFQPVVFVGRCVMERALANDPLVRPVQMTQSVSVRAE